MELRPLLGWVCGSPLFFFSFQNMGQTSGIKWDIMGSTTAESIKWFRMDLISATPLPILFKFSILTRFEGQFKRLSINFPLGKLLIFNFTNMIIKGNVESGLVKGELGLFCFCFFPREWLWIIFKKERRRKNEPFFFTRPGSSLNQETLEIQLNQYNCFHALSSNPLFQPVSLPWHRRSSKFELWNFSGALLLLILNTKLISGLFLLSGYKKLESLKCHCRVLCHSSLLLNC